MRNVTVIVVIALGLLATASYATPVCQDHENEHGFACRDADPPRAPISVPEPATALLLGAGVVAVGAAWRRRSARK